MNLDRVQKKGEKLSSREYDKVRTVQHKNRKGTLPNIASPAKINTSESESSDENYPIEKEEGLNYRTDEKNKNMMSIKSQNSHMTLPVLRWSKM